VPNIVFAFGSRGVRDATTIYHALDQLAKFTTELWSGGAEGADRLAACWAGSRGLRIREFLADWDKFGKSAGIRRTRKLVTELPKDAICVAFADCSRHKAVKAGNLASVLTAGTRFTVGHLLENGFRPYVVFIDGSVTQAIPRTTRPAGIDEAPHGARLDATPTDEVALEDGYEVRGTRPYWRPGQVAETEHKLGDIVTDRDGRRWRVVYVSADRQSVRLRPEGIAGPHVGEPKRQLLSAGAGPADEDDQETLRRSFPGPQVQDENLDEPLPEHKLRGHGDAERRSQDSGDNGPFVPRGRHELCRMCGQSCRPPEGEDSICQACQETFMTC
jgi:hypothetical protein